MEQEASIADNTTPEGTSRILERLMTGRDLELLQAIRDPGLHARIAGIAALTMPSRIRIITGPDGIDYVRRRALELREEIPTSRPRHTAHFDGPRDLARDRGNTRILVEGGRRIPFINTMDRREGLREVRALLKGIMRGREMLVAFYCFGPRNSSFSMHAVQVTDTPYVLHNEFILYRDCYSEFVERSPGLEYAMFIHSKGEVDGNGWSVNLDKRRVYLDLEEYTGYAVNTQYGGNTIGLKKPMFRFCIHKGYREGWLCEHMFITGVEGPGGRITYFTGAFPAGCGKTSTAFASDRIVGDDLAIVKPVDGETRAVNPEVGMFGIIDGVNPRDDPVLYRLLEDPSVEVVFHNILLTDDGEPWWNGKDTPPRPGINYAGRWTPDSGEPPSHPNARFTISLRALPTLDPRVDDPNGVPVSVMVFGGRDPDTSPPVEESYDWVHGVITKGAVLESEKTSATLGKAGVREMNPFAILDFLSVGVGEFIRLHLDYARRVDKLPRIFGVNYFLKDEQGKYIAEKTDKRVWLKWMELRAHGEAGALETPTGLIPLYDDLVDLFRRHLGKEYPRERYEKEFAVRARMQLARIERALEFYRQDPTTPRELYDVLGEQARRLKEAMNKWGSVIPPSRLDRR